MKRLNQKKSSAEWDLFLDEGRELVKYLDEQHFDWYREVLPLGEIYRQEHPDQTNQFFRDTFGFRIKSLDTKVRFSFIRDEKGNIYKILDIKQDDDLIPEFYVRYNINESILSDFKHTLSAIKKQFEIDNVSPEIEKRINNYKNLDSDQKIDLYELIKSLPDRQSKPLFEKLRSQAKVNKRLVCKSFNSEITEQLLIDTFENDCNVISEIIEMFNNLDTEIVSVRTRDNNTHQTAEFIIKGLDKDLFLIYDFSYNGFNFEKWIEAEGEDTTFRENFQIGNPDSLTKIDGIKQGITKIINDYKRFIEQNNLPPNLFDHLNKQLELLTKNDSPDKKLDIYNDIKKISDPHQKELLLNIFKKKASKRKRLIRKV